MGLDIRMALLRVLLLCLFQSLWGQREGKGQGGSLGPMPPFSQGPPELSAGVGLQPHNTWESLSSHSLLYPREGCQPRLMSQGPLLAMAKDTPSNSIWFLCLSSWLPLGNPSPPCPILISQEEIQGTMRPSPLQANSQAGAWSILCLGDPVCAQ